MKQLQLLTLFFIFGGHIFAQQIDINHQIDKISGQLTWNLSLKPYETKKIVFSFNIKVPKNKIRVLRRINDSRIRSPRFL